MTRLAGAPAAAAAAVIATLVAAPALRAAEEPPKAAALGAVVVTAQKREEPPERVPAALTVLSGERLQHSGASSALDLGEFVPGLQSDRANGLQLTIRGVTSPDASEKGDPSVAFHLDGVYLARPQSLGGGFLDVARIEVLRGPQGTLYGRNATAGVINVVTHKPQPFPDAGAAVGLSDHQARVLEGMVNLPLHDELALRVAVLRRVRDTELHGSVPSPYGPGGDTDETAARVQLRSRRTAAPWRGGNCCCRPTSPPRRAPWPRASRSRSSTT